MKEEVLRCLIDEELTGDEIRARFSFPPDLEVFKGHFPGFPIVPGVFFLEMARLVAERRAGAPLRIAEVVQAKFTAEVGPGETVEVRLSLEESAGDWTCAATVAAKAGTAASVRLRLKTPDAA